MDNINAQVVAKAASAAFERKVSGECKKSDLALADPVCRTRTFDVSTSNEMLE